MNREHAEAAHASAVVGEAWTHMRWCLDCRLHVQWNIDGPHTEPSATIVQCPKCKEILARIYETP